MQRIRKLTIIERKEISLMWKYRNAMKGIFPNGPDFIRHCWTLLFLKSEEIPGLPLGDDCKKVILNTKGSNDNEVERSLIDFLHYVENSGENRDGFTYEDNRD